MTPPTVLSVLHGVIRIFPLKIFCTVLFLVPFVQMAINIHHLSRTTHSPGSMCSASFPGYARILDLPVTLADGGVQTAGDKYPPGAWWLKDGLMRGCPCSVRPCVRPCCPNGLYVDIIAENNRLRVSCRHPEDNPDYVATDPFWVSSSDLSKKISVSPSHFSLLDANCVDDSWAVLHNVSLTEDGNIQSMGLTFPASISNFCFNAREGRLVWYKPLLCLKAADMNLRALQRRHHRTGLMTLVIITALHLMTVVVFVMIPAMRAADHTLCLLGYSLATLVFKVIYTVDTVFKYHNLNEEIMTEWLSNSLGCVMLCWQFLIIWQMWFTFSPGNLRKVGSKRSYKKFILYSAICWGIGGLELGIDMSLPGKNINYYLMSAGAVASLCLNTATFRRLNTCLVESTRVRGMESRAHNVEECQRAAVFLKVSLVTGLDFTVSNLLNFVHIIVNGKQVMDLSFWRYFTIIHTSVNMLKGVEVFYFSILQRSTWVMIKDQFYPMK